MLYIALELLISKNLHLKNLNNTNREDWLLDLRPLLHHRRPIFNQLSILDHSQNGKPKLVNAGVASEEEAHEIVERLPRDDLVVIPRTAAFALLPNHHVCVLGERSRLKGSGVPEDESVVLLIFFVDAFPRPLFGSGKKVTMDGRMLVLNK